MRPEREPVLIDSAGIHPGKRKNVSLFKFVLKISYLTDISGEVMDQ